MAEVRLLGLVGLWADERRVFAGTPRLQGLIAALALTPNGVVPADVLIDRVWGEAVPSQARNSLYSYVSRLRAAFRSLGHEVPPTLRQDGGGYMLEIDPLAIDLHRVRHLAGVAVGATAEAAAINVARLREACDLWRGNPLSGVPGDWADRTRDSLVLERLTVLTKCFAAELLAGRHLEMIGRLNEALAEYPFAEDLVGHLMTALYRSGRQAEALEAFRRTRGRMVDEIGAEPGVALHNLHRAILQRDPSIGPTSTEFAPAITSSAASVSPIARPHATATPAQLPAKLSSLTGRDEYLHMLDQMYERIEHSSAPMVISGMPGVGKTVLAVTWAHRVKSEFPDGQLFVNLRGYTPNATAMTAREALSALMGGLGLPVTAMPTELAELEGRYRSLLADRRFLILLDDAASAEQVAPLLPGGSGCLVIVTSRDDLRGLAVLHDARRIVVPPLTPAGAKGLLQRCIGDERVQAESDRLADIARLCGYLPLALRIVAANLGSRPGMSLRAAVQQLSLSADRAALELPGQGNLSVLTSFEVSVRALAPRSQRLLWLLGLVPGCDVNAATASALAGAPQHEVADALNEIAAGHLLESDDGERFQQHDLLRRFARDWAEHEVAEEERQAAKLRLYDHYLRSVDSAVARLYHSDRLPRMNPVPGSAPQTFHDDGAALRFLTEEYVNIVEAAKSAATDGNQPYAWHLADALRGYMAACRPRADWLETAHTGLEAARQVKDVFAEAAMRRSLALAYDGMSQQQNADRHRAVAIRLSAASGDPRRQAAAVLNAGNQKFRRSHFAEAATDYEHAAELNRAIGDGHGMAVALLNLSGTVLALSKIGMAIEYADQARRAFREISSHHGELECLHILAVGHALRSNIEEAIAFGRELMEGAAHVGAVRHEALALIDLSRAHLFAGEFQLALEHANASATLSLNLDDSLYLCPATTLGADSLLQMGRHSEARTGYHRALRLAEELSYLEGRINTLLGLSALDYAVGDLASAAEHAGRGHDLSVQAGMRLMEGLALVSLAEVEKHQQDFETARIHLTLALEILADAPGHPAALRAGQLATDIPPDQLVKVSSRRR